MSQLWRLVLLQLIVTMPQITTAASTPATSASTSAAAPPPTTTVASTSKPTTKTSAATPTPSPTTTTTTTVAPTSPTAAPTTTSTAAPTTMSTAAPTTMSTAATTEAPALGVDCSNKTNSNDWCNTAISGEAKCGTDGRCRCVSGHFQFNTTMCIPDIDLVPTTIDISGVTTSSFVVSWLQKDNVRDLSLSYNVTAKLASGGGGLSEVPCDVHMNYTEATCSGLGSGYMYNVTVTTEFSTGHSGFSIKQESTFPNIPGSLKISSSSFDISNISLVWTGSSGRVDFYHVKVTESSDTSAVVSSQNTANAQPQIDLTGLTAGTHYKVFITAHSYSKSSREGEDMFRTLTDVPGPPGDITVEAVSTNSINISWQVTNQPNGDLRGHKVCIKYKVYSDDSFTKPECENITDADTLELEKTGLHAGTFYQFDVYTINDMYISSSSSKEQRTQQSVPGKVNRLTATPNDILIKVTWQRPSQPNGDIITYQIHWTRLTDQQNCTAYLKSPNSGTSHNTVCYHNISDADSITVNQLNMEYTIMDLMPHTEYKIEVRAYTNVGAGEVDSKTTQTSISVPDPVTDVVVEVLNATAVNVSWTIPEVNPGPVNYTVTTNNMVDSVSSQQSCSVQGFNSSSCVVASLEEYWIYSFSVVASTDAGSSDPKVSDNITTEEAEPGLSTVISSKLYNGTVDCDATKVEIVWEEPALRDRNSLIIQYKFNEEDSSEIRYYDVENPDPYSARNSRFSKELINLIPEKSYNWKLYAVSSQSRSGQETMFTVTQGVCAPPDWDNTVVQSVTETDTSTSSVTILLPSPFFEKAQQGSIMEKGLIILPRESQFFDNTWNINHSELKDWKAARSVQFINEYKVKISEKVSAKFVVGTDSGCSTTGTEYNFCNGPLPERFSFKLAAYVCTVRTSILLCTVSSPFGPFATRAKPVTSASSDNWVIAVAVLLVLGAVIGAFAFLWYKGVIDPKSWLPARKMKEEEPPFTPIDTIEKNRPIPLSRYSTVLDEMHRDTNLLLSDQYDDINKIGQIVAETSTTNAARAESNTPKNRWVNILPYDHSRVKLQQIDEDDPTSDYINANYIPGFYSKRDYIATQGPLPGTIDDFWRMVWEHNVVVIVMLTQCKEGNRVKCEKYWPDELREPKQYGEVVVNPTSISQLDKYNISIFDVSVNGQQSRQVIHFHYLDFPDFSANVEFDHFINFVRTVRNHVPHDMTGPMITHCSAGVGRTGTFIATDRLNLYLNSPKFDENDEVDIFGIVVSMRENRVSMVQTESQYIMIHDCFEKMLEDKKKSMQMTDSEENLYANQGFEPYPEVLYENVPSSQQQTEL